MPSWGLVSFSFLTTETQHEMLRSRTRHHEAALSSYRGALEFGAGLVESGGRVGSSSLHFRIDCRASIRGRHYVSM